MELRGGGRKIQSEVDLKENGRKEMGDRSRNNITQKFYHKKRVIKWSNSQRKGNKFCKRRE